MLRQFLLIDPSVRRERRRCRGDYAFESFHAISPLIEFDSGQAVTLHCPLIIDEMRSSRGGYQDPFRSGGVDFLSVPPVAFIARVTEDRGLTGEMQ